MGWNDLLKDVAEQAKRIAALEEDKRRKEEIDLRLKLVTAEYGGARAYTNLVMAVGYAGFFALWGFARDVAPGGLLLPALLVMVVSVAGFVLFDVFRVLQISSGVRRKLQAGLSNKDPIGQLREIELLDQQHQRAFGMIWVFHIALVVPTGVVALGLLAADIILALLT